MQINKSKVLNLKHEYMRELEKEKGAYHYDLDKFLIYAYHTQTYTQI